MSDLLPGPARDADAAGPGVGRAVRTALEDLLAAVAHAGHAVTVDQHHVGHVDGGLGRDDPAGGAGATALVDDLGVLLDAVHALHDDPLLLAEHQDHLAL